MTNLESQLRDCFSRHAGDVTASPTLASGVRTRSRQMSKRNQTAAALAIVPVTAGVVGGAVAIGHHGSASHPTNTAKIHVAATASKTPSKTPTTKPSNPKIFFKLKTCPVGQSVKLRARDGSAVIGHGAPSTHLVITRAFHMGADASKIKALYYLADTNSKGRIKGVEMVKRNGTRHWSTVSRSSDGTLTSHPATFLGCVKR
jgi:hypothetical protein